MRAKPHVAALVAVLAGAAAVAARLPAGVTLQPGQEPPGTPVIDPAPPPEPLYLPVVAAEFDLRAPGPVAAVAEGYLFPLTAQGRRACFPGTHGLTEKDDPASSPVAVAYALRPNDPATALDLYVGSLVELAGVDELPPAACAAVAPRLLGVDRVRLRDRPGGRP
jgi:hypothetical protein